MNGKLAKAHRKTAREGAIMAAQAVTPAIETALNNEQITRHRVEALERFVALPFLQRLRWLVFGVQPLTSEVKSKGTR